MKSLVNNVRRGTGYAVLSGIASLLIGGLSYEVNKIYIMSHHPVFSSISPNNIPAGLYEKFFHEVAVPALPSAALIVALTFSGGMLLSRWYTHRRGESFTDEI